ncbi:MAG: DUF547 domain-containing protein [Candidatus Poribacteria bacterium]|nr:DUF547 domain-containing protein [Candidatus Poribacteria bacterium]
MKNRILIGSLLLLSILSVIFQYHYRVEADSREDTQTSITLFSHDLFNQVLQDHVINGMVDYAKLKANPEKFEKYLDQLTIAKPAEMDFNTQFAFWINAYNALIIKGVIDHYPTKSVRKVKLFGGFFSRLKFQVAGKTYTLNQIEHDIIRAEFVDPRAHFALVCASKSCPPLENSVYLPETIEEQLDAVTLKFITNPEKVKLDRGKRRVYLSKIFKWYKKDFTEGYDGVADFLADYLPTEDADFVLSKDVKFHYLDYDWTLNDIK